tara:strand:+ start:97 stop:2187 length:2091 start_codon:yes stop_codon:yes gene_type:complete
MSSQTFEEYKDTLEKEPTDPDAKKEYIVGCYTSDDWTHIHQVLMEDGTLEDNIPPQSVDCVDDYKHSPIRGRYLLNDAEVEQLRNHEKVEYVNINTDKYPGTYAIDPVLLQDIERQDRYSSNVQYYKDHSTNNNGFNSTDITRKNRSTYQQLRLQQKTRGFSNDASTLNQKGQQWGTGKDVDVIVCDQDAWFGHIEFQNNLGGPQNYVGGNVLPGNGSCDVLDMILDGPYYLDPDFFDADASRRTTRWDGTTVPTESAARNWWSYDSTSYRSAKFVSPSNGGTATGVNNFGSLFITSSYTRARCNGSNTSYQTGNGYHGTPCASQAYGRQYGWAYNSNKWYLNLYGSGNPGTERCFDCIKVFHQVKPVNTTHGNQNPTITSNSFGYRSMSPPSSGYYWYRPATTDGTTNGTSYSSKPNFLNYFYQSTIRTEIRPNSMLTAGVEMIDAGVIMCCSAGNTNQKLVSATHPDYNNYINSSDNVALDSTSVSQYGYTWYRTVNRQGFPAQVGQQGTGNSRIYRTICVGALDSAHRSGNTGMEVKADYSNMGDLIDCYAPAIDTLAACDDNTGTRYNRNDAYYRIGNTDSVESEDCIFGGTSSATPVTCGIIATKLEHNRTWTWQDVKNWLRDDVGTQSISDFYHGGEATSANDSLWTNRDVVHHDEVVVVWDAVSGTEPTSDLKFSGNGLSITGVNLKIV